MSLLHSKFFRKLNRNAGRRITWLRAVAGGDHSGAQVVNTQGNYFIEMPLADDVRARFYANKRDIQDEVFGEIAKGQTMMSFMPDEIQPRRDDRFIDRVAAFNAEVVLEPSDEQTRSLGHTNIVSIGAVVVEGVVLPSSAYSLQDSKLQWTGSAPESPAIVFLKHRPIYEFLGESWKDGPIDEDGNPLSTWIPLRLLSAGEE